MYVATTGSECVSCLLHLKHHTAITQAFRQDFRLRTRPGRKLRKSMVKNNFNSIKLDISLVKTLTAVTNQPTVYMCMTLLAFKCNELTEFRVICIANLHTL